MATVRQFLEKRMQMASYWLAQVPAQHERFWLETWSSSQMNRINETFDIKSQTSKHYNQLIPFPS
jgi:hypothetical protein